MMYLRCVGKTVYSCDVIAPRVWRDCCALPPPPPTTRYCTRLYANTRIGYYRYDDDDDDDDDNNNNNHNNLLHVRVSVRAPGEVRRAGLVFAPVVADFRVGRRSVNLRERPQHNREFDK